MKLVKLFSLFIIAISFMSFTAINSKNLTTQNSAFGTSVKWKSDAIELGEITQNKPVTIEFEFTNTSNSDIIVANAQASCGCTVADYPKTPIAAGKSAKITATYNAAALGAFSKNVTVTIQNEDAKVLNFRGTVI